MRICTSLQSLRRQLIDSANLERSTTSARIFSSSTELLRRRAAEGWIRDVHGDLHCEHVCFAPEGIQIFDCIEFNPSPPLRSRR